MMGVAFVIFIPEKSFFTNSVPPPSTHCICRLPTLESFSPTKLLELRLGGDHVLGIDATSVVLSDIVMLLIIVRGLQKRCMRRHSGILVTIAV